MTWPSMPLGARMAAVYTGGSWRVLVACSYRQGEATHPDLWSAMTQALTRYRGQG